LSPLQDSPPPKAGTLQHWKWLEPRPLPCCTFWQAPADARNASLVRQLSDGLAKPATGVISLPLPVVFGTIQVR
jgi:hypothetical protein